MKKIGIHTSCRKLLADVYTPVGIYLRLRDRFRDTILLESTDHHSPENSYSFICVQAIAGIEVKDREKIELKWPGQNPERVAIRNVKEVTTIIWDFMQGFEVQAIGSKEEKFAQGLYGYTSYDAIQLFDKFQPATRDPQPTAHSLQPKDYSPEPEARIPLMRYRLYQYVIVINHFRDELFICENKIAGLESELSLLESLIRGKDTPVYPFKATGEESSNMSDEFYMEMVKKGIAHCHRGDVFQVVLSRCFSRGFTGDEFNVYRALRSINPSPYLFYFDYGDYKLMGSSPEAHLVVRNRMAVLHPIAGTFKRTGDDEVDRAAAERLLRDAKENAEHVMLVDLARNDLSRVCDDVRVEHYREVQYFSHVIHLVSEVSGITRAGYNPFELMANTFPAGTLSGAPKFRAMELIDAIEPTNRGYYGGAIGFLGFDGSCNHAIMIRTFLSRDNTLSFQAGAGIVAASNPESELEEVNNKLGALKKAITMGEGL